MSGVLTAGQGGIVTTGEYRVRLVSRLAFVALTLVGVARIADTVTRSFQTHDEPFHVGCGMLWLAGEYPYACLDQPPLARVASALPLAAAGVRALHFSRRAYLEGSAVLRSGGAYERNLALARLAMIPFFVLASVIVWVWTRRLHGEVAALAAVFLFQGLPTVLTFSGIVMTDIALAATLSATLFLFVCWLEAPSWRRAVCWGAFAGAAVLAKHSAIPFLVVGLAPILVVRAIEKRGRRGMVPARRRARELLLASLVATAVVWAGYRFQLTPLTQPEDRPHRIGRLLGVERWPSSFLRETFFRAVELPVPAGDLLHGMAIVKVHNTEGHTVFYRGAVRTNGSWDFFPTMFALKTPIPYLLLLAAGCGLLLRRSRRARWQDFAPVFAALGIFVFAMTSRINLGLRHVLPVFPLLSIEAGLGLAALARAHRWRPGGPVVAAALALWFAAAGWRAHPDYLPYFNELVTEPSRIVVDSDFELGQDIEPLLAEASRRGVTTLHYWCRDCIFLGIADLPPLPAGPSTLLELTPYEPVEGWVGVSESTFRLDNQTLREPGREAGPFDWLEGRPFLRIGKTMRLYPPADSQ